MGAWRGASTSPVDSASGSTASGALQIVAAAPSLTPSNNDELQVYFYGSQSSVAPTISVSNALTSLLNLRSSKEGFALAFADLAAPYANNASTTYSATASISGTAVMTAQAVLLLPASLSPSPSPTGTLTATMTMTRTATPTAIPTNTATVVPTQAPTATPTSIIVGGTLPTPTAIATALPAGITFVGAGPLADYSTAVTAVSVALPQGIRAGDVLVTQIIIYDGSASDVPSTPNGWTAIRHDTVSGTNQATSWLYYKVASANEPGSYGWNIGSNWAAGVMGAWRGASASPIDSAAGATAIGASPVSVSAPSLTPSSNNEMELYFYASQSGSAPSIVLAGPQAQLFDDRSSKEGFTLAFSDLTAPSASNAAATYPATASVSGSAAMIGQDLLLVPGQSASPTPTMTPVPTITATVVPTTVPTPTTTAKATTTAAPTGVATPGTITFVGSGPLSSSSLAMTTVTVGLPSGVESGDVLLAQIVVYDGSGSDVPTPPGGWTSIRHDSVTDGNLITSWLYYKVAGGNEPSSYGWNISSNWAAGVMGDWRGVATAPIDSASGTAVAGSSPLSVSAPSLTPSNNNELQVYFYGAQSHAGPTVALPSVLSQRFDTASSVEGFTVAFGDLAAPSAGNASSTYSATATMSGSIAMTAQAVLLQAVSGSGSNK
jgi:hypothetical protein